MSDYVLCPLLFAFRRVYGIEPGYVPPHQLWAQTMGEAFTWIHLQYREAKGISWAEILRQWDTLWGRHVEGMDLAQAQFHNARGIRYLLEIYEQITEGMEVLPRYPLTRKIGPYTIRGDALARSFSKKGHGRKYREIEIILVDTETHRIPTDFEACRRIDLLISWYGFAEQIRKDFRKLAHKIKTMIYAPRVPHLGEFKVEERGIRQATKWIECVFDSMARAHFFPRPGSHCQECFYRPVCDVRYVSTDALKRGDTVDEIRRKLWPTTSEPT